MYKRQALGYAFIIPFKNSKKDEKGNWLKVYEPTFQMGYKGYIQRAMRTGQYRTCLLYTSSCRLP